MSRGKSRRSLELIEACIEILQEIQPATVRAVCYRLFVLGLITSMAKNNTNKVGTQLTWAREQALIPWTWIVDETREVETVSTWADPAAFAETVTRSYRRHKWDAQPARVEVWSEKGTVRGILAPILDKYEVPFRVMHGYASATTMQAITHTSLSTPQPLVALYVGDWDPSGLHMSEVDLPGRLAKYRYLEAGASVEGTTPVVVRLALAAVDVADPDLPSFDADTKQGDPRWRWFVERYGRTCWEVDALSPVVLRARVEAAIVAHVDQPTWARYVVAERAELASITRTVGAWRELAEAGR